MKHGFDFCLSGQKFSFGEVVIMYKMYKLVIAKNL